MKTITVTGDPSSLSAIMVDKSIAYTEHETVRVESSDTGTSAEKVIFRIIDAGDEGNEIQFQ